MNIPKKPHLNPFDYHKYLINEYVLKKPGDTKLLYQEDTSKFRTDRDIILKNLKFIWNEEDIPKTYEERLAKKYYDKLFREYCICDLSRYKENKIANRFRVEKEVVVGKGQFICGEKSCNIQDNLRTWEVNFAYVEKKERKNALVKLRLCEECSDKLNYHSRKKEIKRLKRRQEKSKSHSKSRERSVEQPSTSERGKSKTPAISQANEEEQYEKSPAKHIPPPLDDENLWKRNNESEIKDRDEEFDDYLADLLL